MRTGRNILTDEYQRICFGDNTTNAARVDALTFKKGDGCVCRFRRDSDQQTAGGLRIEQQVAVFLRNTRCETPATANEIAAAIQSAPEKSVTRRIHPPIRIP